jgi:hypothetical protein
MKQMIVILICDGDAEAIESYCTQMQVHGYYLTGHGFEDIPPYIAHFFRPSAVPTQI